jgi:hypothetical protein
MKFCKCLKRFIKTEKKVKIPLEINEQEILVRGIMHPFFYSESKKKIKGEAFLPPPKRKDVSTLRLKYTTSNFCKNHSARLKMANNRYVGLGLIGINNIILLNPSTNNLVEVIATPLDELGNEIKHKIIYNTTKGLPMHADILYTYEFVEGSPPPQEIRKIAEQIAKQTKLYLDPNPESLDWLGDELIL